MVGRKTLSKKSSLSPETSTARQGSDVPFGSGIPRALNDLHDYTFYTLYTFYTFVTFNSALMQEASFRTKDNPLSDCTY